MFFSRLTRWTDGALAAWVTVHTTEPIVGGGQAPAVLGRGATHSLRFGGLRKKGRGDPGKHFILIKIRWDRKKTPSRSDVVIIFKIVLTHRLHVIRIKMSPLG